MRKKPILLYLSLSKKPLTSCILMVSMSALAIFLPSKGLRHYFQIGLGGLGLVYFGLITGYVLYRRFRHRPIITVDERGITDQSSLSAVGLIPWGQIVELRVYPFMNQQFLGIFVRNPDDLLNKQTWIARRLAAANRHLVPTPFNIAEANIPILATELLQKIQAYRTE